MHLHKWGDWIPAGTIYSAKHIQTVTFDESELLEVGAYFEVGCERKECGKVKGRPVYD